MATNKSIKRALISVFYKEGLESIIRSLHDKNVTLYSTGGTYEFINSLGIPCTRIEDVTGYPSILGGRVKTLHPKVFGGILGRPDLAQDVKDMNEYQIDPFDLVIVNLYPFEETMNSGASHDEIIEKIDIGGISLIRAAAKNYNDVLCISSANQYSELKEIVERDHCESTIDERIRFAGLAFERSSTYDKEIANYFAQYSTKNTKEGAQTSDSSRTNMILSTESNTFSVSVTNAVHLRYGENPHQKGVFYGDLDKVFVQLHGKELSYNNLLDLEAGISLIKDFKETTFAVLKHNNACGCACRDTLKDAWKAALDADPLSAYGGVLISNTPIDIITAEEINKIFFEIILAP
ncbi:MAG: bifunctional phosphoribosylaminoimidazolecarboxamide formyltransferase/IMP cyclohydrolase PurH, partial [Omnitrophica WOR_2 bacterium]